MEVKVGNIYIAPGERQMKIVVRKEGGLVLRITEDPPYNGFAPSVDVMFKSAVSIERKHMIGVLLTGMGVDGALGLLKLKKADAFTIAQDEATSVVYGMPRHALQLGAVQMGTPLPQIAGRILKQIGTQQRPMWVSK